MNIRTCFIASFLLLGALLYGCTNTTEEMRTDKADVTNTETPVVLVFKNRDQELSNEISEQVTKSLEYAKIPFRTIDLSLIRQEFIIPETVRMIFITSSELEEINPSEVEDLVKFVSEGNSLVFGLPVWDKSFGFLEGIKKDSDFTTNTKATEFIFNEDVFPNFAGSEFLSGKQAFHLGIDATEFVDSIKVIASAKSDPEYPVVTENTIGLGKVFLFNTMFFYEKSFRSLLFTVMTRGLSGVPYPVANVSTIFLDDFPAPVYNEKLPPIDEEYDVTHAQFYTDIWWPDMKALADTFNIDYSGVLAFNYNANVVPPFDFEEWETGEQQNRTKKGSIWLARDIVRSRHDLAFHGYNHFSLLHRNWVNSQFMVAAVQAAKKRWVVDGLGPLPVTYVPPNNEIDSLGLSSLKKGFPSLKYMSSLYIGELEDGEGREFGPDPYVSELFDYPRISSGFSNSDNSVFEQNGLYQHLGIWTHFVHPDDVFQIIDRDDDEFKTRNPRRLGWHSNNKLDYGLYEVFRKRIIETNQRYPLTRYLSAKDAVPIVQDWLNATLAYTFNDGTINYDLNLNGNPFLSSATDSTIFWFMFADQANSELIKSRVKEIADEYAISDYWSGSLIQFSTSKSSISLPDLSSKYRFSQNIINKQRSEILSRYHSYIAEKPEDSSESMTQEERLDYALNVLNNNPGSRKIQERVIELAVEQEQVELAIKILEKRLLNHGSKQWQNSDLKRLFTYYGWEDRIRDAWNFLDKLWAQNQNKYAIAAKDKVVAMYGYPNEETRDLWLDREIAIDNNNVEALRTYATLNQDQETWPKTKNYLQRLINLNRSSDSLYFYTLERSFYYDEPEETIDLLESFPESARPQLKPLAREIANVYAYSAGDYTKALQWSAYVQNFPIRTKLEWLLQQKRYNAMIETGRGYLAEYPDDDSTRVFLGQQLTYEGFYEEGYKTLYPLFQKDNAPQSVQELVHTEISYKSYAEKKSFFREYPAFYSDSLERGLTQKFRRNEGTKAGINASYVSDNFDNDRVEAGIFTEWGKRQKYSHLVTLDEFFVSSDVLGTNTSVQLVHLGYEYKRKYREQSMQSTIGGGLYYENGEVLPEAKLGFWYAKDSTFTSGELTLDPVLTNLGIQRTINRYRFILYREDFWAGNNIQTAFSGNGSYYSDDVFSFEALARIYIKLPFSRPRWRYRGIGELSYSDATVNYSSGIPYYTPDALLIEGLGFSFQYRDLLQNPDFSLEFEVMGKNDNRDGLFLTSAARLNATINKYWELSLDSEISSSSVYRYNNFGFTLSYTFPGGLKEE